MNISFQLDINPEDKKALCSILQCSTNELSQKLSQYGTAALREYLDMILGRKALRRGSDMREYRLFLLVDECFEGKIPDENQVSSLFQTTTTESRTLIRSIMSKYQYKLREHVHKSIVDILESVSMPDEEGGDLSVTIPSSNLVDEMNKILSRVDGSLPPIRLKRNSTSVYLIKPSANHCLRKHFDLKEM